MDKQDFYALDEAIYKQIQIDRKKTNKSRIRHTLTEWKRC